MKPGGVIGACGGKAGGGKTTRVKLTILSSRARKDWMCFHHHRLNQFRPPCCEAPMQPVSGDTCEREWRHPNVISLDLYVYSGILRVKKLWWNFVSEDHRVLTVLTGFVFSLKSLAHVVARLHYFSQRQTGSQGLLVLTVFKMVDSCEKASKDKIVKRDLKRLQVESSSFMKCFGSQISFELLRRFLHFLLPERGMFEVKMRMVP